MVIVGEFVGGAALGAAFGLLFDVVKRAVVEPTTFKSLLENIKFSLEFLKPVIGKIREHNVELGLPDEEIKHLITEMEEGAKLVRQSIKVSRWNCMKFYYTDKLIELDGSLKRLFHILMVQGVRDAKETLVLAREHQDQLIESTKVAKETLVLADKNAKEGKETLVVARQNADRLMELAKDGKETLTLARQNADQLTESARDRKETLVLARKTKRLLKRIEWMVACTSKGKSRPHSDNRVSKPSRRARKRQIVEATNLRIFCLAELRDATCNFREDNKLSEDFFGKVFKGWLDEQTLSASKVGTGMTVAIHRLIPEQMQCSEVNIIGRLSHPNIEKLLGYCCEETEMLLVYEYMPNGSLHEHLFGSPDREILSWESRIKIAIGTAQGLNFLHCLENQIIHRDLKPKNILLDLSYNTKLSNLYLSRWGSANEESGVTDRICGTLGYIDPYYWGTGSVSVKSDVYSFGVVLLQILTGLKLLDLGFHGEQISLVHRAIPLFSDEREFQSIMDPKIEGQYSSKEAFQIACLTLKCLETDPKSRPSMEEIVEELESIRATKEKVEKQNRSQFASTQPSLI